MAFFGSNIVFDKKAMMGKKTFNNKAFESIMKGKGGKFLDTPNKKKKFFEYMKQSADKQGKLTKDGMKEALWRMKKDGIMGGKIETFAQEVLPGTGINRFKEVKEPAPATKDIASQPQEAKSSLFFKEKKIEEAPMAGQKTSASVRSAGPVTASPINVKPTLKTFNVSSLPRESYASKKSPEQEEAERKVQYWNLLRQSTHKADDDEGIKDKAA